MKNKARWKVKGHVLSMTENVKRGLKTLDYLVERPVASMVGLGLIYGRPGIGKTHFAMRMALDRGYIYSYLTANDTPKTFVRRLLEIVNVNFGIDDPDSLYGTTTTLFHRIKLVLNRNTKEGKIPVMFIDEIDYALSGKDRERLIGTIRDLVDHTAAVVIMIGMEEARAKLMKMNRHYFARCNYFCNFKKITKGDAKVICKDISAVELDEAFMNFVADSSGGDIRNVIKLLYSAEGAAERLGQKRLSLVEYEKSL